MPDEIPFQIGEVVKFTSGGPLMTVAWVDELITCQWFSRFDELNTADFQPSLLIPAVKP